jgi:hypothetical protein
LIIGNPGISKSWLQYKIILFCLKQNLFYDLWKSFTEKDKVHRLKKNDVVDAGAIPMTDPVLERKSSGKMQEMEADESNTEQKGWDNNKSICTGSSLAVDGETINPPILCEPQERLLLWWQKAIVRTLAGTKSYCIYIDAENTHDVFMVRKHTPDDLEWLTDEDTLIL